MRLLVFQWKLYGGDTLEDFSVKDRMAWMEGRQTMEEEEDLAYSLIGFLAYLWSLDMAKEGREHWNDFMRGWKKRAANNKPFIVPFHRTPRFVGHESQLAELEGKLFAGASTTKLAITGTGGIGKTQLALELAYRVREKFKNCLVFWILVSDIETLRRAYANIAKRLNIPGSDEENADFKKLVQVYLSKESAGQWLLVFDITDEARLGNAGLSQAASLVESLPVSNQGAIIFTTPDKKTAFTLASQDIIDLPEMEHDVAQKMLAMYLISTANELEVTNLLLHELAYLPLAIVQAAAYININKITLRKYLVLLAEQKEKVADPTGKESKDVIALTWLISFEQIRRQHPLAADDLLFMACIDPTDVPLALLLTTSPTEKGIDAIGTLNAYSSVTKRTAESALDLHRLVSLSTRNWLEKQELLSEWTQVAIARLLEVFPDDDHGNRSKWRRLLPHTKSALSSGLPGQENEARMNLAYKHSMALLRDGRFDEAEVYFKDTLQSFKEVLGPEHASTLDIMSLLAFIYRNQGRWKEAEELQATELEICSRVLGPEDPLTLDSMAILASIYIDQGRWKEAEELQTTELEIFSRVLGAQYTHLGNSIPNLALIYRHRGRWKEAEDLEVQVIETRKTVLGAEHPATLNSISNLASIYRKQGRWKEAEDLEVQVMETKKRVLGAEHPDTLTSMNNLAFIRKGQGQDKEALKLMEEWLALRSRTIGTNHRDTVSSRTALLAWQTEELEVGALDRE